jgi:hypothetical protein
VSGFEFDRFAGSRQMRIRTVEDLLRIRNLPETHWVATACPKSAIACDPQFLRFLDEDGNERIRVREVIEAINWLCRMLRDPSGAVPGSDVLVLERLSPEALPLRAAADLVLENLSASDRTKISLADVRRTSEIFRKVSSNGDGIITPDSSSDPEARELAEDILRVMPGATDKSGARGLDLATIEAFLAARKSAIAWLDRGDAFAGLGEGTIARSLLVAEARPKVDEYFLECRLVASQPEALEKLKLKAEDVTASIGDRSALTRALEVLPIALPDPSGRLDFSRLHRGGSFELLQRLRTEVLGPILGAKGASVLPEEDWRKIVTDAEPIVAWKKEEGSFPVLAIGAERLRKVSDRAIGELREGCQRDLRFGGTLGALGQLEKLILFQRWLFTFVNNFVSMPHLYNREQRALFEQGTLILGGREFTLSIRIYDRAHHAALAEEAGMFMMYVEVYGSSEKAFELAVPVTAGRSDELWVGKNGIFQTIAGDELDARIVQLVVQPVSLWEALTLPFSRIGNFISQRFEKFGKKLNEDLSKTAARPLAPITGGPPPPQAAAPIPIAMAPSQGLGGLLMGGSVAFAAIGSALAFIAAQLQKMIVEDPLTFFLSLFIILAILFTPIAIIAWLKLRRRNLAIVLEGAGWALNDRLRLTQKLGRLFTRRPPIPS